VKLQNLFELQSGLASVQRYSQTRLNNPESVLEHTGCVALTCYLFGLILFEEKHEFNFEVLLCKSIAHDIDEIVTGDIPRPTKYYSKQVRDMFYEIENDGMLGVCESLDIGGKASSAMFVDWIASKDEKEGLLVAVSDRLAIVYKAWQEYIVYGNHAIKGHLRRSKEMLEEYAEAIELQFPGSSIVSLVLEAVEMCDKVKGE